MFNLRPVLPPRRCQRPHRPWSKTRSSIDHFSIVTRNPFDANQWHLIYLRLNWDIPLASWRHRWQRPWKIPWHPGMEPQTFIMKKKPVLWNFQQKFEKYYCQVTLERHYKSCEGQIKMWCNLLCWDKDILLRHCTGQIVTLKLVSFDLDIETKRHRTRLVQQPELF